MKKINNDNKGFSLIELLVATAILAIIMTGVAWILSSMSKSFGNSQREISLQDNVQATYDIVSSLIKESQASDKSVSDKQYHDEVIMDVDNNVLFIFSEAINQKNSTYSHKAVSDDDSKLYVVYHDVNSKKLYLYEDSSYAPTKYILTSGTGTDASYSFKKAAFNEYIEGIAAGVVGADENLLAQNVESFSCDTSNIKDGFVVLDIELKNGSREAAITQNVYIRNSNTGAKTTNDESDDDEDEPGATEDITGNCNFVGIATESNLAPVTDDIIANNAIRAYFTSDVEYGTKKQLRKSYLCPDCSAALEDKGPYKENATDTQGRHLFRCTGSCNRKNYDWPWDPKKLTVVEGPDYVDVQVPINNTGTLLIRNETQTTYDKVVVTLYFKDDDAYFKAISGNTDFLKLNTSLTKCAGNVSYVTSLPSNNKVKYIQIKIQQLKGYTVAGDKKNYDDLVLNYSWSDASGNTAVMCSYTIEVNSDKY